MHSLMVFFLVVSLSPSSVVLVLQFGFSTFGFRLRFFFPPTLSLSTFSLHTISGEARGHACHAKHDQKSPE